MSLSWLSNEVLHSKFILCFYLEDPCKSNEDGGWETGYYTRGLTFGNQFWSAVSPFFLLCYTVHTQPHTHCPAQWVLARLLLWRWQPQSIIPIIVLFWFFKNSMYPMEISRVPSFGTVEWFQLILAPKGHQRASNIYFSKLVCIPRAQKKT